MRFDAGPATEQGLEADAHDPPTLADHPTGNGGMRATAVAAGERQEGNGRGDAVRLSTEISSRGTKVRCGEAVISTFGSANGGNVANLMTGSGMQQARSLSSGGSRRGGAKPRGRNVTSRGDPWSRSAE